ncbi:MAG TPA: hypothetical protein VHU92_21375 [Streptosporangiaceae bacterium]|jgi:hypothetical protein|nr:hypothetical protein [Streptosporangiaceae bacterium]
MRQQQVTDRWNAAIADVLARVDATLADATAGSHAVIANLGSDLGPLTQPWTAVQHQMHQYTSEISDTWNRVSDEFSSVDDLPEGATWREGGKRNWATKEVDIRYNRAWRLVMAAAADVLRDRALQADARTRVCRRCGAPLDRIRLSGLALNVECGYCLAINTIEPGPALRMFAVVGAMHLAERQALGQWEAMTRTLTQINSYRDRQEVPLDLLREYERAGRGYWTERITAEADYAPEQRPYVQQKIDTYMKGVNKKLREHWQWRQLAGG